MILQLHQNVVRLSMGNSDSRRRRLLLVGAGGRVSETNLETLDERMLSVLLLSCYLLGCCCWWLLLMLLLVVVVVVALWLERPQ